MQKRLVKEKKMNTIEAYACNCIPYCSCKPVGCVPGEPPLQTQVTLYMNSSGAGSVSAKYVAAGFWAK